GLAHVPLVRDFIHDFRQGQPQKLRRILQIAMIFIPSSQRLFRLALLGAMATPFLLVLVTLARNPHAVAKTRLVLWLCAYAAFILLFWLTARRTEKLSRAWLTVSLIVQIAPVLVMINGICSGSEGALLVVVAGQLAPIFSLPLSLSWVAGQTLLMGLVIRSHFSFEIALTLSASWLGVQVFTVFMSQAVAREATARNELAKLNAELRATQQLVVDSSKIAERMRIARELHDLLGHHLTGLSLNLEVASHLTQGQAQDHIQTAQSVTKLLLDDVREVVNSLRGEDSFDVGRAVRTLTKDIPKPQIHLDVPDDLGIYDPVRAKTILRCVQEIITNAVRHSGAQNLWIELLKSADGVEVRARDDGRGVKQLRCGNGLTGMRERVEHVGGRLEIESTPSIGFRLKARIPAPESST
ncbi:MAG TPA: sensor histidine kinase, partial [Candidatus Sulfotelmatobacter sp.]|nr:sensor histidine kinase [Candidatus Sulfotelmatobacter sp.]